MSFLFLVSNSMSIIYFFDLLEEVWIFVWHFFFSKNSIWTDQDMQKFISASHTNVPNCKTDLLKCKSDLPKCDSDLLKNKRELAKSTVTDNHTEPQTTWDSHKNLTQP